MVWAGIMINGRTRLHVVANGSMTGQLYIDEVLLPHVRLFRSSVGDKFVFMDDNATCHRILAVWDCLDSEGIQRLVWPVRSPDLNPIENVWDALGREFELERLRAELRNKLDENKLKAGNRINDLANVCILSGKRTAEVSEPVNKCRPLINRVVNKSVESATSCDFEKENCDPPSERDKRFAPV
ncbi:transposable element Tcb2 transposase [Trichonephila clavipes]|nr:transposable element Tcb2 transposase [Trichonephila clavipes]